MLASAHTIVTYDRRGNSRSPRPPEWTATTIDEQADDAAALLGALDVEQTVVMGTSAAAGIVANLALRHDSLLRGVVIHEPLFQAVVTNADAVRAGRRALIEAGLAKGGRRGATEAFLRYAAGETVYDSLDRALRERLLGNGEVLIGIEMGPYVAYEPTRDELATMRVSRAVTAGADNRRPNAPGHWRYESAQWLAAQLATGLIELPGAHMGYLSDPRLFAEALAPVLRALA